MKEENGKTDQGRGSARTTGLVLLAAVLVLGGCSSNGAGGDGDSDSELSAETFSIASVTGTLAAGTLMSSDPESEAYSVGTELYYGLLSYSSSGFIGNLEGWDGQTGTYTYDTVTLTVEQNGNIWSWTSHNSESGDTVVYKIERLTDQWSFSWTISGFIFIKGHVSFDGMSGDMTIYDQDTGYKMFEIFWEPAGGQWYLAYTINWYNQTTGALDDTATIHTNQAGTSGTYTFDGGMTEVNW